MKPHEKIYEAAEKLTGKRGAEILFLDDRADNLAPAAARGPSAVVARVRAARGERAACYGARGEPQRPPRDRGGA